MHRSRATGAGGDVRHSLSLLPRSRGATSTPPDQHAITRAEENVHRAHLLLSCTHQHSTTSTLPLLTSSSSTSPRRGNECLATPAEAVTPDAFPAGVCVHLRFEARASTSPLTDALTPYLGAAAHLFIAPADDTEWDATSPPAANLPRAPKQTAAVHAHAYASIDRSTLRANSPTGRLSRALCEDTSLAGYYPMQPVPATFGPGLEALVRLPRPGKWRAYVTFSRAGGQLVTAAYEWTAVQRGSQDVSEEITPSALATLDDSSSMCEGAVITHDASQRHQSSKTQSSVTLVIGIAVGIGAAVLLLLFALLKRRSAVLQQLRRLTDRQAGGRKGGTLQVEVRSGVTLSACATPAAGPSASASTASTTGTREYAGSAAGSVVDGEQVNVVEDKEEKRSWV